MKRPKKGEFAQFYEGYIQAVPPRSSPQRLLKSTFKDAQVLLGKLPETMGDHAYEPGKWTIKQVSICRCLCHCASHQLNLWLQQLTVTTKMKIRPSFQGK